MPGFDPKNRRVIVTGTPFIHRSNSIKISPKLVPKVLVQTPVGLEHDETSLDEHLQAVRKAWGWSLPTGCSARAPRFAFPTSTARLARRRPRSSGRNSDSERTGEAAGELEVIHFELRLSHNDSLQTGNGI